MPFSSLKGDRAFNRIRAGKPGRGKYLGIRWFPLRAGVVNPTRVGIIASKKVGNAVVRNLLRRRIKEILRKTDLPPCEAVIVVYPEAAKATFSELVGDLAKAFRKSGLLP